MQRTGFYLWVALAVTGTSGLSKAQGVVGPTPSAPVVDEGFTFYNVEHSSISGSEPPASEWFLKANLRVVGNLPPRSVLRYVLSQGDRRVGEVRCETRSLFSSARPNESYPHVFTTECKDRNLRVREVGEFLVEWHLVNGDTDADTLLVTHKVVIRSAPRFDVGSQRPWYPAIYVDRHGELLSTVLWQHPAGMADYAGGSPRVMPGARIDLLVNASPAWGTSALRLDGVNLRCRVDGQPIDLRTPWAYGPASGTRTDAVSISEAASTMGEEMVPNPSGNPRYDNEQYLFRRYLVALPLTFGAEATQRRDATPIERHPGAWECDLRTGDARTLRTFRFAVGTEGRVAPHVEQTEGGLTLAPDAVFVETVIPEGNPLDARTLPDAPATLAFSGRGFRTDTGRALARTVPAVGQPTPRGSERPGRSGGAARGNRGRAH